MKQPGARSVFLFLFEALLLLRVPLLQLLRLLLMPLLHLLALGVIAAPLVQALMLLLLFLLQVLPILLLPAVELLLLLLVSLIVLWITRVRSGALLHGRKLIRMNHISVIRPGSAFSAIGSDRAGRRRPVGCSRGSRIHHAAPAELGWPGSGRNGRAAVIV